MARVAIGSRADARLVHQDHLRLHGDCPGDAQTLLLAAGQRHAALVEFVLDLVPQSGARQGVLHDIADLLLVPAEDPRAVGDVVEDALREGVGLLEDHPDPAPHLDRIHVRAVDVHPVVEHLAFDTGARDQVVHTVERTQQRRLPTTTRTDECGDLAAGDGQVHLLDGLVVAVVDIEILMSSLGHVFMSDSDAGAVHFATSATRVRRS